MFRSIRTYAYLALILQVLGAIVVFANAYNDKQIVLGLALLLLPIMTFFALYMGPTRKDMKMRRKLERARMESELEDLETKLSKSKNKDKK